MVIKTLQKAQEKEVVTVEMMVMVVVIVEMAVMKTNWVEQFDYRRLLL